MPSKRLKLTQEQVATAKETLDAIPPAPRELRPITVSEAIRTLTPTIRRLIDRGHSREAVLRFLKEQGIECSPSTFKECYRPGRGKNPAKPAADNDGGPPRTVPGTGVGSAASGAAPNAASKPPVSPTTSPPLQRPGVVQPAGESRVDQRPNAGQPSAVAKAS
jgi:hypothetical protein